MSNKSTKTHRIISLWVAMRALLTTLHCSLNVLIYCLFKKPNREYIDILCHNWAQKLIKTAKVDYHIHYADELELNDQQKYLIMSNHLSHYDIPLVYMAIPGSIRMIAKQELFKLPIWGSAMLRSEFICLDRKNSKQALKDLAVAKQKIADGIRLWIAPEGTRSRSGKLQSFKPGGFKLALESQADILPVVIKGSDSILAADSSMIQTKQRVDIYVGQLIDTSNYGSKNRRQLMEDVRIRMLNLLQQ